MATEQQSVYDRLFPVRLAMFIALILIVQLFIVMLFYTFLLEKPFHHVLTAEREQFSDALTPKLHNTMRFTGDKTYNTLFVNTQLESVAYNSLAVAQQDDDAIVSVKQLGMFGLMFDNLFDYGLLMSYRLGFLFVSMSFFGCLIGAAAVHGLVARHRKRYGFGDTALILNLWARSFVAYSIPVTFLIWTLPFTLNPAVLFVSLAVCAGCVAVFSFSLPKIA